MMHSMPENCWQEQSSGSSNFSLRITPGMGRWAPPKGDFITSRKRLSSTDLAPNMWLLPGQFENEHSRAAETWVTLTSMK